MLQTPAPLPAMPDMELEVLAKMLLKEGSAIPTITSIINADDFFIKENQIIFKAIISLYARRIPPNILSLIEELRSTNDLDKVGLHRVLALGENAFTTAYAASYANTIKEKSNLRKLIQFSEKIYDDAFKPNANFNDISSYIEKTFRAITEKSTPQPLISEHQYFANTIVNDIANIKLYFERFTGFSNIDQHQIFSPGLYVIGATPAAGKTTFCWQLLNQLAVNGEHCIFCSYEMSALELFSKTLARELFLRDKNTSLTAADIRRGATSNELEQLLINYANDKNLKGINLLELRDESVDDLIRILRPFCTKKDKAPIVCVDYLQIIPPSLDQRLTSDKAKIDDIVRKLKSFQRETNTTFIVVSSFNRLNYYQQVSFESFKESGNIEYTADVVWALQLNVVNNIKLGSTISEIRKKFENAKLKQPRDIQLKCLKNRQGNNYDVFFNYYSAHDFFEPVTNNTYIKEDLQDESFDIG